MTFSDATIRRFHLAQLSANEQSQFEAALFSSSQFESRVRLIEFELSDEYAANNLSNHERTAFQQKFLVTTGRRNKLEVSNAVQAKFGSQLAVQRAQPNAAQRFDWPRFAWRVAFAVIALVVFLASAVVIRREPERVKRIIPRRFRPAVSSAPTPEPAHHAESSSETPMHRDDSTVLPSHEASPQTVILRSSVGIDDAPVVIYEQSSQLLRLEIMLERIDAASFSIVVTAGDGEIVHNVPEIHVEASDRIDFDVQIERLKPGEFRVVLTRINDESPAPATYYFRVQKLN